MKQQKWMAALLACWLMLAFGVQTQAQTLIYTQNFNALTPGATPPGYTVNGAGAFVVNTYRPTSAPNNATIGSIVNSSTFTNAVPMYTAMTAAADMQILYSQTLTMGSGWYEEMGVVLRGNSGGTAGYVVVPQLYAPGSLYNLTIQRMTGGTQTQVATGVIAANQYSGANPTDGSQVTIRAEIITNGDNSVTVHARSWPYNTTEPSGWQVTYTDNSPVLSTGYFGFSGAYAGSGFTGGAANLDDVSAYVYGASTASFVAAPSTITAGGTVSVTVTGTNTSWTSGTSFSVTNATISGLTVSGQSATFTLHSTGAAGTPIVLSDTTDSATASISVTVGVPVPTIYADNANWKYIGPHVTTGSGAASKTQFVSVGTGYQATVSGTTTLAACYDVTGVTNYADVAFWVDGTIYRYSLTNTGLVTLTLPALQTVHTVRALHMPLEGVSTHLVWTNQADAVKFLGFQADNGATLLAQPDNPTVFAYVTDSTGLTYNALDTSGTVTSYDFAHSWALMLADDFGADLHMQGHSGTGVAANVSNVTYANGGWPVATTWFGYAWAGVAYSPPVAPVVTIVDLGINDNNAGVLSGAFQTAYTNLLNEIYTAWPNTICFCVDMPNVPFTTAITNAIAGSSAAGKAYLVDLSAASLATLDNTHPNRTGQVQEYAALKTIIATKLALRGVKLQAATVSSGASLVVTVTNPTSSATSRLVSWTADSLATSYKVMRSTDGTNYVKIATVGAGTTTYTDAARPATGNVTYTVLSVH